MFQVKRILTMKAFSLLFQGFTTIILLHFPAKSVILDAQVLIYAMLQWDVRKHQ
jgi:hypothetical protein